MGIRLDRDAYLYGMQHAYTILNANGPRNGIKTLEAEIQARTGGMKLPAVVDLCVITDLAREQIKPELQCLSVAMAWALEKGLKLPQTRIEVFLDIFNDKILEYRANPEQKEMDSRILDQSWGGALAAGQKWYQMYEDRKNADAEEGNEA
jgi:hypothetical protein